MAKQRSLKEFVGTLSEESAERLEKTIRELRKRHSASHRERIKNTVASLEGS